MAVLPDVKDFKPLATTAPQPGLGEVMVGPDMRLYRKTRGLMEIICEVEPTEKTVPGLYYGGVNWDEYPKMQYLADLYDQFFSRYKREVMLLVGKLHDPKPGKCPWMFMVPRQVGTTGSISWDDLKGTNWFLQHARFLGTIHVHPGAGTSPSGPDLRHWEEKDCSGIHVIFGRNGAFSVHGSAYGHAVSIADGTVEGIERLPAPLCTSMNQSLGSLLRIPKELKKVRTLVPANYKQDIDEWLKSNKSQVDGNRNGDLEEWEDFLFSVSLMSAIGDPGVASSIGELWLICHGDDSYLLSSEDYKRYLCQRLAYKRDDAPLGICLVAKTRGAK